MSARIFRTTREYHPQEFVSIIFVPKYIQIFSTCKKTKEKNLVAEHPSKWLHVHSPRLDDNGSLSGKYTKLINAYNLCFSQFHTGNITIITKTEESISFFLSRGGFLLIALGV